MKIPPANNPTWDDPAFRTAYLHGLIAIYGLKHKDIAHITGASILTVRHWCSGKHAPIKRDTLRALAYDLREGAGA